MKTIIFWLSAIILLSSMTAFANKVTVNITISNHSKHSLIVSNVKKNPNPTVSFTGIQKGDTITEGKSQQLSITSPPSRIGLAIFFKSGLIMSIQGISKNSFRIGSFCKQNQAIYSSNAFTLSKVQIKNGKASFNLSIPIECPMIKVIGNKQG